MKRRIAFILIIASLFVFSASALSVNPLGLFDLRIHCGIEQSGGVVRGGVVAALQPGETAAFTVRLQHRTPTGIWLTLAQVSGDGSDEMLVSCSATSGHTYRVSYTYSYYASEDSAPQYGSGTSATIRVP